MAIRGKFNPLRNKVLVHNMNFGEEKLDSGIILKSDNGTGTGVHPRWAQVWAIGPEQTDVKIGEWILMEHGRWTRAIPYEDEDGNEFDVFMVDLKGMLCASDKPTAIGPGVAAAAGGNFNFNIPG